MKIKKILKNLCEKTAMIAKKIVISQQKFFDNVIIWWNKAAILTKFTMNELENKR